MFIKFIVYFLLPTLTFGFLFDLVKKTTFFGSLKILQQNIRTIRYSDKKKRKKNDRKNEEGKKNAIKFVRKKKIYRRFTTTYKLVLFV